MAGVLLLLWGADSLARVGAESLLERNIQSAAGAAERPEVTVRGRFFLPQVIRGSYDEVDVTTRGITSGPLRVDRLDSQLLDVRVPFHDVLVQDVRRIGVGQSTEDVAITYPDLNAYFDATGRPLEVAPADDGLVTITGKVDVLGRSLQASADVELTAEDGSLRLTPRHMDTASGDLDRASRLLLRQRLSLTVPLGSLPFGHDLTRVTPTPDGIQATAVGSAVIVEP
ncbi:LmeA family phospholipid-binding protein [Microlunatus ginsengisoli]|uniref:DUF2993 domain-containing protein n=1 Tax=Microlunatus ginsengisoli TaxID=363863 RepID=A0ABP6ZE01_9ACTN